MASDSLNQLGKRLGKTRQDIRYTSKNVSKNLPIVEESSDIFGAINTFKFEFKTYSEQTDVHLGIVIKEKFRTVRQINGQS